MPGTHVQVSSGAFNAFSNEYQERLELLQPQDNSRLLHLLVGNLIL